VLAALLLDANRCVPADRIVERVWGDRRLPDRPSNAVQTYVSLLRRALGGIAQATLTRQSSGYMFQVDEQRVDVHVFRGLVGRARSVDDSERAGVLLRQALGLWRGEAFGVLDTPWFNSARAMLNKEGQVAERDLTDIQLRALRRLHHQILTNDPALAVVPRPFPVPVAPLPVVPRQLPAAPRLFTGRTRELAIITDAAADELADTTTVIATSGRGGLGKTCLALHWVHQNRHRFPDGQLYVNHAGRREICRPKLNCGRQSGLQLKVARDVIQGQVLEGGHRRLRRDQVRLAGAEWVIALGDPPGADRAGDGEEGLAERRVPAVLEPFGYRYDQPVVST
jgi:hypothetical protein